MFNSKKPKAVSGGMINTIIGDNSKIEGLLLTSDSTRVDGLLQGKILSESSVIIGEHGVIRGDSKIEITGTGRVLGDLITKTLVIDEGASFKGNCTMDLSEDDSTSRPSIPDKDSEEFSYSEPSIEDLEDLEDPKKPDMEDKDETDNE